MAEETEHTAAIVLDMGSDLFQCGFGDHYNPRAVFPPVLGSPKGSPSESSTTIFIGDEAMAKREDLRLRSPLKNGKITNWIDMERIWRYSFEQGLRIDVDEYRILIAEAVGTSKEEKERIAQVMFETFNVQAVCFQAAAALSLYHSGRSTGLVIDSGLEETRVVPIYEGYCIPHATKTVDMGGKHITDYVLGHLEDQGLSGSKIFKESIAKDFKRKMISVHQSKIDLNAERGEEHNSGLYELPDGTTISIPGGKFMAAESLFQPSIIQKSDDFALHKLIHESVGKLDCDIKGDMYANTVLVGGNTNFEGIEDRLEKEVAAAPHQLKNARKKIVAQPGRTYCTWLGGAIFSCLNGFAEMCITKEAYNENGPSIVHRFST